MKSPFDIAPSRILAALVLLCLSATTIACVYPIEEDCEVSGDGSFASPLPADALDDAWLDFEIAIDRRVAIDGVSIVRFAHSATDVGFAGMSARDGIALTIVVVDTSGLDASNIHPVLRIPRDPADEPVDVLGIPLNSLPATWVFADGGRLVLAANDPDVPWETVNEFVERARRL